MLHAHARKRELVDELSGLGINISYDRVLRISAEMGNGVCQNFLVENVVCPPKFWGEIFTTAAVYNIDHNPSSTTAYDSFHGTGISLLQHPDHDSQGTDRGIVIIRGTSNVKAVGHLPHDHTDVQPVTSPNKNPPVPAGTQKLLQRTPAETEMGQEKMWLQVVKDACDDDVQRPRNTSWAAYNAHNQPAQNITVTPTACFHSSTPKLTWWQRYVMPWMLWRQQSTSWTLDKVPVVMFDQPLYAIAKQVQWNWPNTYGEDLFVIMLGGLDTEMAVLKTAEDGSGWT